MMTMEDISKEIEKSTKRAFVTSYFGIFGQYLYDWITDPKRIRKSHHRQAIEDLKNMRFF